MVTNSEKCFVINDKRVQCKDKEGAILADVIRNLELKKGTKIACREGDCGACTMLVGQKCKEGFLYSTITSCISPLINAAGKHVVTIEGICQKKNQWHPIQKILAEHSGTQCGYCTPGFVISLLNFFLNARSSNYIEAKQFIDGNICRCTGYKSIERALKSLISQYEVVLQYSTNRRVSILIEHGLLPSYFEQIPSLLANERVYQKDYQEKNYLTKTVGGGTDLFVQKPRSMYDAKITTTMHQINRSTETVFTKDNHIIINQHASIEDLRNSDFCHQFFPNLKEELKLFASTQIRYQASVMGNLVNASPIADITSLLLALESHLIIKGPNNSRKLPLDKFFLSYKKVQLLENEIIEFVMVPLPDPKTFVHIEKVSKRTILDIASVNTSIKLLVKNSNIDEISVSAGGVGPTPQRLYKFENKLRGNQLSDDLVIHSIKECNSEVSPMSDVRGSKSYKLRLLKNLLFSHFLMAYPDKFSMENMP